MMTFIYDVFIGWQRYQFVRVALVGVLLFAPMYGMLGTMIVNGRMAFFSDSLGHSALTGVALGVLLGMRDPLLAMLLFGVAFAALLCWVKARGKSSADTTLGVFSSAAMALGVVLLSLRGDFAKYSNYLIGDLLSISARDLIPLSAALGLVALYSALRYNRLLLVSANASLARSRGINPLAVEIEFTAVVALVVMLSIRWVGVLMLNAMLVIPAACARNVSDSVRAYIARAIVIALACGVAGLLLSFAAGTSSGATIVLLLTVCYAVTLACAK
ncbi:MAG: metal ABC transporter permease [Oscillospiraceae bacterium]|jgi:zinc transport system permease protein|nr:metal ABC transporter permease [Oscillospiraceae bacterium]